jgi:hypothetical protein
MGFLAGLICSLGGALKDSPYEGFYPLKFCRSIIVGTLCGMASSLFVPASQPVIIFMFAGYSERMIVEGYKILRANKPGKFSLPHPSMLGKRLGFRKIFLGLVILACALTALADWRLSTVLTAHLNEVDYVSR